MGFKRFVCVLLTALLCLSSLPISVLAADSPADTVTVQVSGEQNGAFADEVVRLVNIEREKVGAAPLTMDQDLLDAAMQRAAETAVYFEHTRPDGTECYTVSSKAFGENIAVGAATPESVVAMWMNSDGHRKNMLNASYTTIGVGYFGSFWVQLFGFDKALPAETAETGTVVRDVTIDPEICSIILQAQSIDSAMMVGDTRQAGSYIANPSSAGRGAILVPSSLAWASSDTAVATVDTNGLIRAVGTGTATITGTLAGETVHYDITVAPKPPAVVDSGTCGANLTWTLDDAGTLTISGTGAMEDYERYGENTAPWYGRNIKTAILEKGVLTIGNSAFFEQESLEDIQISSTVTRIGDNSFMNCKNIKCIEIPNSMTEIGNNTFLHCSNLKSIVIPDSVTKLGYNTFAYCTSLSDVSLPDSLTYLSSVLFQNCTSLKMIEIPESIESIDTEVFRDCTSLEEVIFSGNSKLNGFSASVFQNCKSLRTINLPDNIKIIADNVFSGCYALENIILPEGLETIYSNAFANCVSLKEVSIPDSVWLLGESAFAGCTSMTSVKLPNNTSVIAMDTLANTLFDGCTSLESITIPASVTAIGNYTFRNCTSLKNITIEGNITNIGTGAFRGCAALESFSVPETVTTIGAYTFADCGALTSVTIPASVTTIGSNAFANCSEDLTIIAPEGSAAQAYAQENNIIFKALVIPVTGVTITMDVATPDVYIGDSLTLKAVIEPANATNQNVRWTSSHPEVATIDGNGIVTGISEGTTIITVTTDDGGLTNTCEVRVSKPYVPVAGITLDKTEATMQIGDSLTLIPTITPSDATNQDVFWLSDNPAAISVENGVVTANSAGTATITVVTNDGHYQASCKVTAVDISLDRYEMSISMTEKINLKLEVMPEDTNIIWTSDDPDVATVDNGVVTGVRLGTTTVRATTEDGSVAVACQVTVERKGVLGDIDMNKQINASDALMALRHSVREIDLSNTERFGYDAFWRANVTASKDKDNDVNASDALQILRYSVKEIDSFV